MTPLDKDLLQRILTGTGRVYSHEAKAMAAEILSWRKLADDAAKARPPKSCTSPQHHPTTCGCGQGILQCKSCSKTQHAQAGTPCYSCGATL